jgi:hypothetical protein
MRDSTHWNLRNGLTTRGSFAYVVFATRPAPVAQQPPVVRLIHVDLDARCVSRVPSASFRTFVLNHPLIRQLQVAAFDHLFHKHAVLRFRSPGCRHPCRPANTSPYRTCRGLSPPSACAPPGAPKKTSPPPKGERLSITARGGVSRRSPAGRPRSARGTRSARTPSAHPDTDGCIQWPRTRPNGSRQPDPRSPECAAYH